MKELVSAVLEVIITLLIKGGFLALLILAITKAVGMDFDWRYVIVVLCLALCNGLFPLQVKIQEPSDD